MESVVLALDIAFYESAGDILLDNSFDPWGLASQVNIVNTMSGTST